MSNQINSLLPSLRSINQREVAVALSTIFIKGIEDPLVRERLQAIRDIAWSDADRSAHPTDYDYDKKYRNQSKFRIQTLLENMPDSSKKMLAEAYVRLGHLYEIAGHTARENFFRAREEKLKKVIEKNGQTPDQNIMTPGGVHELLFYDKNFQNKPVKEVVAALSAPVSEYVFTQHPTNTNTLESMKLQRQIADALDRVTDSGLRRSGNDEKNLEESIARYATEPLTSDSNFTAYDETNIVINFLTNVYHDIDRLYEVAERGLIRKFPQEYDENQRWNLDLKQRFSSWGSGGDKDGNNNIKSENTLEAIILHKKKAAELLVESLHDIDVLAPWKEKLALAAKGYGELEQQMETARKGNDIPLTNAQFKTISGKAQELSRELGSINNFLGDIRQAAEKSSPKDKEKLLALHRKARIFGFNLGKIEYRETAEEYSRVVNVLIKYAESKNEYRYFVKFLRNQEGSDYLTEMLRNKDSIEMWTKIASGFMQEMRGEELRTYIKAGAQVSQEITPGDKTIAYHTLRRMELARDFDDMISHNVLAECQGTQNLLEALALQHAVAKENKRAMMNIVPLFEEADTMAQIPQVLKEGLENDAYQAHLQELKQKEKTPHIVQQVQIAHSDNARRAGSIASRGIIHAGHHAARKAIEEYNNAHANAPVDLEFFEGGSQSDSYRNGVRAVTAVIHDFGLQKFAKMTFQGGDLLNYFNEPTSCERLMLRSIVEQAKLNNSTANNGEENSLERAVAEQIGEMQRQYDVNYYDKISNPIGKILHALDYRKQAMAGSAGTRGNRVAEDYSKEAITGVDARNVRTISFSETLQHGGLHPACLGTKSIEQDLSRRLFSNAPARDELEKEIKGKAFDDKGQLTAVGLKQLYKKSRTFRDSIDKMAYGLMNTRVGALTNQLEKYQQTHGKSGERDHVLDQAFHDIIGEYKEVCDTVYKTLTGLEITADQRQLINSGNNFVTILERTIALLKSIPELEQYEMLHCKHHFVDGLDIIEKESGLQNSRLAHNARDTLYHGRTFVADDRHYGRALMATQREQERNPGRG